MKHSLLIIAALTIATAGIAQGNSQGKGNGKMKHNNGKSGKIKANKSVNDNNASWNNTDINNANVSKTSKNQPAKVRAAFQRDYPNAGNVTWSKYRGDWTATFNSGIGRSTAVYHANGDRKDTRTNINRSQLPNGTIWDRIFRRDRVTPVGNIVQIQSPSLGSEIFRIASQAAGSKLQYLFYNSNGQRVQYDY